MTSSTVSQGWTKYWCDEDDGPYFFLNYNNEIGVHVPRRWPRAVAQIDARDRHLLASNHETELNEGENVRVRVVSVIPVT